MDGWMDTGHNVDIYFIFFCVNCENMQGEKIG